MIVLVLPFTLSLLLLRSSLGDRGNENAHSTAAKPLSVANLSSEPNGTQENRSVHFLDYNGYTASMVNETDQPKGQTPTDQLVHLLLSSPSQVPSPPSDPRMSSPTSLASHHSQVFRFGDDFSNDALPPEMHREVHLNERRLYHALQTKNLADGTEERLYRTLLAEERYQKDDERNQVLTTRSWLNINWMDKRLVWNHTEWDGIKTIYIPHPRLWKPDIILVNNAIREYHASLVSTDIMVTSNGNVTWLFSALFRSSCPIRVRYYPFDDQECDLKFASWSHDGSEIDLGLNTDKGDLSSYMNNSEFDLLDMTAIKEIVSFPSNPVSKWPTIVVRIKMHRRPLFYIFNHIIPCVLISSMAVLGFLMPPETGEKINMIITTLLSMGVYLQSITESIPPTSEAVPLIGMYYVSSLFMVCLATCVNVITLNMHRNGAANQGRHVPCWMEKWILGYLATFMRMSIREPDSVALLKTAQILPRFTTCRSDMLSEFENRFRRILKRIYRSLQQHEIREEIIDERQRIQWQWQQLASVVDRLLLVLFSLATLFTITFFLLLPVGLRDEGEHLRVHK
ncbi:hypothetical protein GCK32_007869 [Trichostrongylus colubriformis]|uniref:Uncharacterized protein n=1 Tax=Trichostrongylus colubriformis TaxID=6319 RepID=A0AAN8EY69_TRICO